jgi:hypothetical protein
MVFRGGTLAPAVIAGFPERAVKRVEPRRARKVGRVRPAARCF